MIVKDKLRNSSRAKKTKETGQLNTTCDSRLHLGPDIGCWGEMAVKDISGTIAKHKIGLKIR